MIDIVMPATLADWLSVMVALATLLIGLGFFLLPEPSLAGSGLPVQPRIPRQSARGVRALPVSSSDFRQAHCCLVNPIFMR
ncbi:MAG: hypothetical protein R3D29_13320 [Nitratireductor sp.]